MQTDGYPDKGRESTMIKTFLTTGELKHESKDFLIAESWDDAWEVITTRDDSIDIPETMSVVTLDGELKFLDGAFVDSIFATRKARSHKDYARLANTMHNVYLKTASQKLFKVI